MSARLGFRGELSTTAMGILPHEDVDEALRPALSVLIPFWPQLPKLSFREDMYVQAMEGFPAYLEVGGMAEAFALTGQSSALYRPFLALDLGAFRSVGGQMVSPVTLVVKVVDEKGRPTAYHDEMRHLAFSFLERKVSVQYREPAAANPRAFVWVVERSFALLQELSSHLAEKYGGIPGVQRAGAA